jgi:transcription elongation factor GreA
MERTPITPEGYDLLVAELRLHKEVLRPENVRALEEARAHGDISENAEYDAAKERQAMLAGKIAMLESMVSNAQIIDVANLPRNGRVVFGTTVRIEHAESGELQTWKIVGETETDVERGRISFKAPLAKALIGREQGDEVVVPTPGGVQRYEIVEVLYL